MRTELRLPEASISLNALRKMHKNDYKRLRDRHFYDFKSQRHYLHPGPVRLTFTRLAPRFFDYDNLVGGAKPIIDALVNAGIITGDKTKHIPERNYSQLQVKGGQECTIIIIEDL